MLFKVRLLFFGCPLLTCHVQQIWNGFVLDEDMILHKICLWADCKYLSKPQPKPLHATLCLSYPQPEPLHTSSTVFFSSSSRSACPTSRRVSPVNIQLLLLQKRSWMLLLLDMVLIPMPHHPCQIGGLIQTNNHLQETLSTFVNLLEAH